MRIEVTKETFYRVFRKDAVKTSKNEICEIHEYHSKKLNQHGLKVWNYASSKVHQYYLTDINY